jgi:hypothetical protein
MNHMRLLAQIKLRETQRQRDRLQNHYNAIEERVARAGSPLERLRALHQGLREVTFAQKPLHPDVRELDALYLADELGVVPPELIADRTRFLERELAQGRLRAEFTYAFGRILSEWADSDTGQAGIPAGPADPFAGMWEEPPALDHGWLGRTFESLRGVLRPIAERVEKFARSDALAPVKKEEVQAVLWQLGQNADLQPALRRQAAEVQGSPTQLTELGGVATILLNSLDEWEWPGGGPPLRPVWVHVKQRPYLDEDLLTALFLQLVGQRWVDEFKGILPWSNLQEGKERFFRPEPPTSLTAWIAEERLHLQGQRFLAALPRYRPHGKANYNAYALLDLIITVEREVRFARAACPDRPLYVVQADLRDYYPSLSHELVLEVLRQLGVPERWRSFFHKFFTPQVHYRGQARPLRRGLALEHTLTTLFAECVLWVLDLHVYRTTGTQLLRTVDDIWCLAGSPQQARTVWQQVEDFCRACGLAVNEAKSGSVCLGSEPGPVEGLPPELPRWGLLRLQPDGTWHIDEPALGRLEETVRQEAAGARSVLALVARYNDYLRYILGQLALPVVLRGNHLRRVGGRLNRMHEELFGPGHGLVEEVGRRLRDCFADARLKERGLPHALLYWPITAGGLALAHPLLHVASYLRDRKLLVAPRPPNRDEVAAFLWRRQGDVRKEPLTGNELGSFWSFNVDVPNRVLTRAQLEDYLRARQLGTDPALPEPAEVDVALAVLWAQYYRGVVFKTEPTDPPPLAAMEQLVKDFIERGSEVSGRRQPGLGAYWRWVVYTYGPSLLEALGTFRFLLTELVPLQLILENRGLEAAADQEPAPAPAAPAVRNTPQPGSGPDDIPF